MTSESHQRHERKLCVIMTKEVLEDWSVMSNSRERLIKIEQHKTKKIEQHQGFSVVKNPPANAGDTSAIPGLRRFPMSRAN